MITKAWLVTFHIKMLLSLLYVGILLEKKDEKTSKEMFSAVH